MAIREHRDDLVAVAHFVEYAIAADADTVRACASREIPGLTWPGIGAQRLDGGKKPASVGG